MDVTQKNPMIARISMEIEAFAPQLLQNVGVFRPIAHMRYAFVQKFATIRSSRDHATAVALRDRFSLNYYCHRRTSCPTNLKSLWLSLPLQLLHAHNKKKKQWYSLLSQSQQAPSTNTSTKTVAGRGFDPARAFPSHSDQRGAL